MYCATLFAIILEEQNPLPSMQTDVLCNNPLRTVNHALISYGPKLLANPL